MHLILRVCSPGAMTQCIYITKQQSEGEKQTKRELENLKKYADPGTLSTARIAEQVRETFRQKKKKDLHKDYEELRVAHIISQEKFTNELQVEKDKSRLLEEELEKFKVWQQEYSQRYEEEVAAARQQAAFLQREIDNQIQTHAAKVSADLALIQKLKAEKDHRKKMEEDFRKQTANKNQSVLQREVEELTKRLNVQMALNLDLSTEFRETRDDDDDTPSRRKRYRPEEPPQEKAEEKPCQSEDQQPGTSRTSSLTTVSHRPRFTKKNKWRRNRNLDDLD